MKYKDSRSAYNRAWEARHPGYGAEKQRSGRVELRNWYVRVALRAAGHGALLRATPEAVPLYREILKIKRAIGATRLMERPVVIDVLAMVGQLKDASVNNHR
jgi:hypothetical protein